MGVIWLGGAAIRAGYKNMHTSRSVDANHLGAPAILLREVLTDQSDRGYRASVIGWCGTVACQVISV